MLNHPLRTVALTIALALIPAASASARTETIRVFSKTDKLVLTQADGTVVGTPKGPPAAGDRLDIYGTDFAGDHKRHSKQPTGSEHTVCTFNDAPEPDCVSHVAIDGSQLIVTGNPGTIVGGSGKYLGATGKVVSNETVGDSNDSDVVAKVNVRPGSAPVASTPKAGTLRFFSRVDEYTLTKADGTVIKNPTQDPAPGERLDIYATDFAGDHKRHAKQATASEHVVCVFTDQAEPDCTSHVAIGSSMLVFSGFPGTVIGGAGRYLDASGKVVSNENVKGTENADIVAKIKVR
jgi:hypothetical protein